MNNCTQISYTQAGSECDGKLGCIKNTTDTGTCICDTTKFFRDGVKGNCECIQNYGLIKGSTCVQCSDVESQMVDSNGNCVCIGNDYIQDSTTGACKKKTNTPCTETKYTTDINCTAIGGEGCVNPTAADAKNCVCKSGFEAQNDGTCKASSSASPLAIALICSLILSIAASIATAAVVIRRKAIERRGAEALVSDAL